MWRVTSYCLVLCPDSYVQCIIHHMLRMQSPSIMRQQCQRAQRPCSFVQAARRCGPSVLGCSCKATPAAAPTTVSRRVVSNALGTGMALAGVAAAAGLAVAARAAAAGGSSRPADARTLVRTGMDKFRRNEVEAAAADFDAAWEAAPGLRPYLWQRGLALYYLGRYEEASDQFRSDVAVNPNDTEESIWDFISKARSAGPDAARQQYLKVGRDPRPVMRAAYETFKNGSGVEPIRAAISDNGGHSNFYGLLYVGLYHEAYGSLDEAAAREAIEAACATPYARLSGDYMADLARVHCMRRGWNVPSS